MIQAASYLLDSSPYPKDSQILGPSSRWQQVQVRAFVLLVPKHPVRWSQLVPAWH